MIGQQQGEGVGEPLVKGRDDLCEQAPCVRCASRSLLLRTCCCGSYQRKFYLDRRGYIGTEFTTQKTLEDGCDYLRDVLLEAEFLDVI